MKEFIKKFFTNMSIIWIIVYTGSSGKNIAIFKINNYYMNRALFSIAFARGVYLEINIFFYVINFKLNKNI